MIIIAVCQAYLIHEILGRFSSGNTVTARMQESCFWDGKNDNEVSACQQIGPQEADSLAYVDEEVVDLLLGMHP